MPNYPRIIAEMARLHWAITPEAMNGIKAALESRLEDKDRGAFHQCSEEEYEFVASELGDRIEGARLARVKGSIGSLLIAGPIVPRADAFTESSGVVSLERLSAEFRMLAENPAIERILLVFDSPGGAVTGVSEFASIIAGCEKHVTAYVQGSAASAAYWLASAADEIISSPTGLSGCLGTMMTVEVNKDDSKIIIRSTQTPLKNVDVKTEEGKAQLTEIASALAQVFIEEVAQNRGVPVETVLSDFGKGAVLVASRARTVGMIDRVDTLANTIKATNNSGANVTVLAAAKTKEKNTMPTLQELLAEHPAVNAEIKAIEVAARKAGADTERAIIEARIAGATPYLHSEKYPEVIKAIAADVMSGKQEVSALQAAVAVFDSFKAKDVVAAAVKDSDDQPDISAKTVVQTSEDGILRSPEDINAEINALRGEIE